nr:xylulose kinase-1 [Tanacetum cinerariifolium]
MFPAMCLEHPLSVTPLSFKFICGLLCTSGLGFASYNIVAPQPAGILAPSSIDLSNSGLEEFQRPEFKGYGPKDGKSGCVDTSNEIKKDPDVPIIEDWVSNSDEDEFKVMETGQREVRPIWNNTVRINHQNFSNSKRNFALTIVLTKSGIVPISTARQSSSRAAAPVSAARPINTAAPKPLVNVAKPRQNALQKSHLLSRRPFYQQTALKNRNLNKKVNTAKVNSVNTAKGNRVIGVVGKQGINAVKSLACWVWRPNSKNSGSYICDPQDALKIKDILSVDVPGQTATGKEFSNPLMAGSLLKTITKSDDNTEFHQIVDFLSLCSINYALTVSPTIYASYIEQFWNTVSSKTINSVKQIHAIVDGKAVVISESSVRSDLLFDDEDEKKTQKFRRTQKDTKLPPTSVPLNLGAYEAIHKEKGDIVERAITTDASLVAAQDSDNINKTQTTEMPNVDIPQGMDTGGSPRRQETIGGTPAQSRSERVLEQPNEPPLSEGHTSGSREVRMEHTFELTNIVPPTPHDSPLTGGYTLGSDEGRLKLLELMNTCTALSNRVTTLKTDVSSTKAIYHKSFITLTKRVKKLETQLKQKRSRAVIHSSDEEEPHLDVEDSPKQGRMIGEIDKDETINLVIKQGEVQKTAEPLKDDDDATLAKTFLNIKRSTTKDKEKESSKKQKLDELTEEEVEAQADIDQEVEEMKLHVKIVPDEDIAIDAIPLATKPLVIVEYKIVKEGKIGTYHIIRVDGSIKRYTSMIKLLENIDGEDLETLWKLIKDKHGNTRPEEDYERVL